MFEIFFSEMRLDWEVDKTFTEACSLGTGFGIRLKRLEIWERMVVPAERDDSCINECFGGFKLMGGVVAGVSRGMDDRGRWEGGLKVLME